MLVSRHTAVWKLGMHHWGHGLTGDGSTRGHRDTGLCYRLCLFPVPIPMFSTLSDPFDANIESEQWGARRAAAAAIAGTAQMYSQSSITTIGAGPCPRDGQDKHCMIHYG